ncbi:MAG: DUF11 domain-containing protein, partial [Akkermansiaceae bacterium]|nr:DUF11 domain-containing protein [Verrucomicrobiales bacterium]
MPSGAAGVRVVGNYIGVDATGTQSLGNTLAGVLLVNAGFNTIGGPSSAERNVISGNEYYGIRLESNSHTNTISGNFIGTDVSGSLDRGNLRHGVQVFSGSYNVFSNNVISGNNSDGVYVVGNSSPGNRFLGNRIGVAAHTATPLGNQGNGIRIEQSSTQVGGTNANDGNIIACNSSMGVSILSGDVTCPVRGNSIYSNSSLGIDLNANGVTANDLGDGDGGGNNLQNYPVLGEAVQYPAETVVTATLNSQASRTYRIEFFHNESADDSGFGEGQNYLGFTNVTTGASGNVAFGFVHPLALPSNNHLTATATDNMGNTSEFSGARRIVAYDSIDLAVNIFDSVDPAPHATNFFYTLTITNAGPTNATSVFVTNTLPENITYVSAVPSQGSASHTAGVVVWDVGVVNDNSMATLVVEVASALTGSVTATAVVVGAEPDNLLSNNTTAEYTFLGVADLAALIMDTPDPVIAGQSLMVTVTVTNAGPDAATGSTLSFNVATNFFIVSNSVSQGMVTFEAGTFTVNFGTIPAGGAASLTGLMIPMDSGAEEWHAEAYHLESDPNYANNISANEVTSIEPGAGVIEFVTPQFSAIESAGNMVLTVRRSGGSVGAVTVGYATSNLTAIAGSDYASTTGTLTFANGETLQLIQIPLLDDIAAECNEAFAVRLLNPTGGAVVVRNTNAAALIFDNEIYSSGTIKLLSGADPNRPPDAGNNDSIKSSVSADGRYVAFSSRANNLVNADDNLNVDVFVRDLLLQTTILVSRALGSGTSQYTGAQYPLISGDGRFVVFTSHGSGVEGHDNNFFRNVFVRDLAAQTTTLISHAAASLASGNNESITAEPTRSLISSNGQSIVFTSYATDLSAGLDDNLSNDVFFHDRVTGSNRLISVNFAGTTSGNNFSFNPIVSGNGQVVAFESMANDLVALPDGNASSDVFVQDLATGVNQLVSVNAAGTAAAIGSSSSAYLSHDGRFIAFQSSSPNLAPNDSTIRTDVFWQDRLTGSNVLVSVNTNGVAGNNYSIARGISVDGRYVLFSSDSSDLVTLTDANFSGDDVFVRDMFSNVTVLVSVNLAGTGTGNSSSFWPVISGDGTHVAFESYATDLTAAVKNGFYADVFVRNLTNNTTRLVSFRNGSTNGPNGSSYDAAISFNGNVTSFTGEAEGGFGEGIMALGGSIDYSDVWAHTFATNTTELVSVSALSVTGNGYSSSAVLSRDGVWAAFYSSAENLVPGDTNEVADIFVINLTNSVIELVSGATDLSANQFSEGPSISAEGRYISFQSDANNLVPGDINFTGDVFVRDMT